jgi:hypothetical protein
MEFLTVSKQQEQCVLQYIEYLTCLLKKPKVYNEEKKGRKKNIFPLASYMKL